MTWIDSLNDSRAMWFNWLRGYLDGLCEQYRGEERDHQWGEPLGRLLVAEGDAVRPEEENGGAHAGERQEPGEIHAPPAE